MLNYQEKKNPKKKKNYNSSGDWQYNWKNKPKYIGTGSNNSSKTWYSKITKENSANKSVKKVKKWATECKWKNNNSRAKYGKKKKNKKKVE